MIEPVVVDLTTVSHSFPETPQPKVTRENLLDTMDAMFAGNTQVVILEGAEGIGKTSLLAQFAQYHPERAFSLFIRPTSRWAYDPEILRWDLCNQLNWALDKRELKEGSPADDAFLRTRLLLLQKRMRQTGKPYFFVVDGLADLPQDSYQVRQMIMDMLPLGVPGFRFLMSSGSDEEGLGLPGQGLLVKCFPVPGFTPDECLRYFSDLNLPTNLVEDIYRTCKRTPAKLASVRRLLQTSSDPHRLVEELPNMLPRLFEFEWRVVDTSNSLLMSLLAIIAHDRREHSTYELAEVVGANVDVVRQLMHDVPFITIDYQKGERLEFVSDAFRRFSAEQLKNYKQQVQDILIDHLMKDPTSDTALTYLPGYLEQAGRLTDLLSYLSPDHFAEMMKRSQSMALLHQKAQLGMVTARKLSKDGDLLRFSIQKSSILGLETPDLYDSEISALMTLNDYDAAIALAQSTVLREDRLRLMALIARHFLERGQTPPAELNEQIQQVCLQIEPRSLSTNQVMEIAVNLIQSNPSLALDLVERARGAEGTHALDWALATLSVATSQSKSDPKWQNVAVENIRLRIKSPAALNVLTGASLLLGDCPADRIVSQVTKLETPAERLYLLRQWMLDNATAPGVGDVIEYAVDLIVKTPTYSPNARVFRELATGIPFVSDTSTRKRLVASFESQLGGILTLGPTDEYVWLQLILSQAEQSIDFEGARNRVHEVYFAVNELDDVAVKTACLARLLSMLPHIDPDRILEAKDQLHTLVEDDLKEHLGVLLSATADHYQVTLRIIDALAQSRPELAVDVALSLNTEQRRNLAMHKLIQSAVDAPLTAANVEILKSALTLMSSPDERDAGFMSIITAVAETKDVPPELLKAVISMNTGIRQLRDPEDRCRAACLFLILLGRNDSYLGLRDHILKVLSDSWNEIDLACKKVNVGFKVVGALADRSPSEARTYFELADAARRELLMDGSNSTGTYSICLQLAIRAYGGLLQKGLALPGDFEELSTLISRVPSSAIRAEAWGDLALRCFLNGDEKAGRVIVVEHVKPALEKTRPDVLSWEKALTGCAPVLYFNHKVTAMEQIRELPIHLKEQAVRAVCDVVFQRVSPYDPYDYVSGQGFDLQHHDLVDICDLIEQLDEDSEIYYRVQHITDTVVRYRKDRFPSQQQIDLANRLERLVDAKLPSARHITHDGYKIVSRAQIARLVPPKHHSWEGLVRDALKVPNTADRAYVLWEIATCLPQREATLRVELFSQAQTLIEHIPSAYDKIEHYQMMAEAVVGVDVHTCRQCLRLAMNCAVQSNDPDVYPVQRKVVDLAYRVDPDLASSLASMADTDPARITMRDKLHEQLELLKLKKKMADLTSGKAGAKDKKADLPRAAWMNLGALHGGRIGTVHIEQTREYLETAVDLPLSESYPLFAWAIENAIRRYGKTDQATAILRPMFEATILATHVASRIAARTKSQLDRTRLHVQRAPEPGSLLIRPGEREKALEFLRAWFSSEVRDYLKICDPFFGPEDLEILQTLQSVVPECRVHILTSKKYQDQENVPIPWEASYRDFWRIRLSDQDPPETEVVVVGTKVGGESPIHDRWWITNGAGLRIGTSLNGLGTKRESEISRMAPPEAESREAEIDRYLRRIEREYHGDKLLYTLFTL